MTKDAGIAARGQHLPVGVRLVKERLAVLGADRSAEQRHERVVVDVLVRRPRLVMASDPPPRTHPKVDGIDGHAPRVDRLGRPRAAQRGARQRPAADETVEELVEIHSAPVAATTHTICPLETDAPGTTATSRTTPGRGATISFSIFIASITQRS